MIFYFNFIYEKNKKGFIDKRILIEKNKFL